MNRLQFAREVSAMRYPNEIPDVIDLLYHAWIPAPDPGQWPEYLREDPVRGYGLYCFYQGIALGLQLEEACRDV